MDEKKACKMIQAAENRTPHGCATPEELAVCLHMNEIIINRDFPRELRLKALYQTDRIFGESTDPEKLEEITDLIIREM